MALKQVLSIFNTIMEPSGKGALIGGTVDVYIPGTTTSITTWSDSDKSAANASPVPLNSGRASVWVDQDCDVVIKNSAGATLYTSLEVNPADSGAIVKLTDQDRTASTAWDPDDDLKDFTLQPNRYYEFQGLLLMSQVVASSGIDITIRMNSDNTPQISSSYYGPWSSGSLNFDFSNSNYSDGWGGNPFEMGLGGATQPVWIKGHVKSHATLVSLAALQWNVGTGGTMRMQNGSWLRFKELKAV